MIDVFVLDFWGNSQLRMFLSDACRYRWYAERECNIYPVPFDNIMEGKKEAEEKSKSPIYVVTDNDCLPLGKDFVKQGVEILNRHPEYGLLAAANICEGEFCSGSIWQAGDEVECRDIVGGVAFVRKGILNEFQMCEPPYVDRTICDKMRSKGYKTGIMPHLRFNHLGAGYSLANPACWMSVPS